MNSHPLVKTATYLLPKLFLINAIHATHNIKVTMRLMIEEYYLARDQSSYDLDLLNYKNIDEMVDVN
ncbi:unnamed protein product [Schistosoma margrebowiei]|uniref:Uncharacterized protein n=1 Tax=Schistosoma margrebowiei TaxID=48269 RepID=A0A183N8H4_9TREM|nr:unnamed protein product [Schistosoma margrebowiei]